MTMDPKRPPVELSGVPDEEHMPATDAAERLDTDPREQRSFTDTHPDDGLGVVDRRLPEES